MDCVGARPIRPSRRRSRDDGPGHTGVSTCPIPTCNASLTLRRYGAPLAARRIRLMTGTGWGLAISVFLACAVEAGEAFTIVLAGGAARSWRSTLTRVGGALLVVAVLAAGVG